MKIFALAAAGAALAVLAHAAEEVLTFKTTDGREFKSVKLNSKNPVGIRVITPAGVEEIPFGKLPPDLQKKFGYPVPKEDGTADVNAAQAAKMQAEQAEKARAAALAAAPPRPPVAFRAVLDPCYAALKTFDAPRLLAQDETVGKLQNVFAALPPSPARESAIKLCDFLRRGAAITAIEAARLKKLPPPPSVPGIENKEGAEYLAFRNGALNGSSFHYAIRVRWENEVGALFRAAEKEWDAIPESAVSADLADFPEGADHAKHLAETHEFHIEVLQVLPTGVLADPHQPSIIDDHAKPIAVGGEVKPVYRRLTNPAFFAGFPNGTKGQTAVVSAYRESDYRFNESTGRVHVVDRWVCVPRP